MQRANLDFVIEQASQHKHALAKAVRDSVEAGTLVPSILRQNLSKAGLKVAQDQTTAAKYGFSALGVLKRVLVLDKQGAIVAMGASGDHDDALLHAMLGWFRENASPETDVPQGIASRTQG